jgi:hypothetical protein
MGVGLWVRTVTCKPPLAPPERDPDAEPDDCEGCQYHSWGAGFDSWCEYYEAYLDEYERLPKCIKEHGP